MSSRTRSKTKATAAHHTGIHRTVVLLSYIYLALPVIIFLLGWCRPLVGVPLAGVCIWALVRSFLIRGNYIEWDCERTSAVKWKLVVIAAVIFAWVALSGVGGYVWQNGDHAWRNSILRILVEYEWPSTAGERGLTYYIGTWLPAALAGKIWGVETAHTALFLWVLLGIFLIYALICIWRRKIDLWPLVILLFFGGLDMIGSCIFAEGTVSIFGAEHLEWWTPRYPYELQYSSNTTQLFWVFNQSVPAWLATLLLFTDEPPQNMIWVSSLIAITSTFPLIGLVPILLYYMFRRSEWHRPESVGQGWKMALHNMGSLQNLLGGGTVLIISFLYLMGNDNFTLLSAAGADSGAESSLRLSVWVPWFILLVAVVLIVLLGTLVIWACKKGKGYALRNILYAAVFLTLAVLFFRALGAGKDSGNEVYRLIYTIVFVLFEAGIYLYLLFRDVEDKGLFSVVALSLAAIPFMRIGVTGDFCMRASIPSLFIVMLWCIETLEKKRKGLRTVALVICLVIGAVSPIHEFKRALIGSQGEYAIETVEEEGIWNAANFSGSLDTFFWYYIAGKEEK